jgi:hypothetical protein
MTSSATRELLLGATRTTRARDEDDDDLSPRPRLAPGKLVTAELADHRAARDRAPATPGKLTHADLDRAAMSPAEALADHGAVAQRFERRIDRRAEPGGDDAGGIGELASALAFIDDAGGHGLPAELAARLGRELGVDLSSVRIHTDDRAAQAAALLRARAFTIDGDVFFAAGAYDPSSADGVALIAHEAAHVAHNLRGGRGGGRQVSRPGDAHEHEADRFADRFAAQFRARAAGDPAMLVDEVRRRGTRTELPFLRELESHFGVPLDFVETYTGEAARLACQLMSAGAFAVRNIVALADPSPQRAQVLHELSHVVQMGQARAPERFAVGSLTIGVAGSAAEHEADRAPRRPTVAANPDTIHRDTAGSGATPSDGKVDLKQLFSDFLATPAGTIQAAVAATDTTSDRYGVVKGGYFDPRLTRTTKPFSGTTYASAIKASHPEAKAEDLKKIHTDYGSTFRLSTIASTADQYIVYGDAAALYPAEVEALAPSKAWKVYTNAVDKLSVPSFKWPNTGPKVNAWSSADPAFTDNEDEKYRDVMRDQIAALPRFAAQNGHWANYYKDVVQSKPRVFPVAYNKLTGDIFNLIILKSQYVTAEKAFADPARGEPIFDVATYGLDATKEAKGDGTATFDGGRKVILEAKAKKSGPTPGDLKQARNYKKILTQQGKGYKLEGDEVTAHEFNHVIYTIADDDKKTNAKKWYDKLFVEAPAIFTLDDASIIPKPDDAPDFKFKVNPEFSVPLGSRNDPRKHYVLSNPRLGHPGVEFKTIDIELDDGKTKLVRGHVVYDLKAGDLTKPNVRTEFQPTAGGDQMATLDGKLKDLKSSLEKVLGPVKVDAAIVDGGVQATLDIQAGTAKSIAGFHVDAIKLTAMYSSTGSLKIDGKVNIRHTSGKISGGVQIGWTTGGWSFNGDLTVKDGMIPGVAGFTVGCQYENGAAVISVDHLKFQKKFKAVTLTGTGRNLTYDTKKGAFAGQAMLEADLGPFGRATADATIADNDLKKVTLMYDSPELAYPKGGKPAIKGTISGAVTYDAGKFSGGITGTANLNVPALQKIAGEHGLGLKVDAKIGPEGQYSGSISTTQPLKLGKFFEIPPFGCQLKEDGSIEGDFAVRIKNIKHLESAEIGCRIDKGGFHVTGANIHVPIGKPDDRFWGTIDIAYDETAGLKIGGTANVKIKEGMVATGILTYKSETQKIDAELSVQEIKLFEFSKRQNLFKFSKQIPLVSFYQIIGIYLDLGLDLDFDFNMHLGLRPKVKLDGLSPETWDYEKIAAQIELLGKLSAALVATPKVGLGLFAVSPSLLRGGGGLKVPITAEAALTPKGTLMVAYTKSGGVEGDAQFGMQLTFGIRGAVKPYAEAAVLDGAWNPSWTGDSLADFEILPPKELFNFTLDLAGDMKPKEPQIPTSPQPVSAPKGKQLPQDAPQRKEVGDNGPGKDATPPVAAPAGAAADDSMFKMASLTGALKGMPGYQAISGFMEKAGKVWNQIKGFFGRVMKAFKSFFAQLGNAIEEVINGFASEGLGYLPKLIQKIVGAEVWDIIGPIVNAAAHSAEEMLQLFETDPPRSPADFFPWGLKLMRKAFGVAFDSLPAMINALNVMRSRLGGLATKIVTKMVREGMIGVKRHHHSFFGMGGYTVADEFKINVLGINIHLKDELTWLPDPSDLSSVPAVGLYEVFEKMGVPHNGDPMRDRWSG